MNEFENRVSNNKKPAYDVDLGDEHWIAWTEFKGTRCGGIITHATTKTESGWCSGAFWINDEFHKACGKPGTVWEFSGTFEKPTLSPSFLCHCGDHGWVRDGRWVRA